MLETRIATKTVGQQFKSWRDQITYLPWSKEIVKYCHAFCTYFRLLEAEWEKKNVPAKDYQSNFTPQSGSIHMFTPQKIAVTIAGHVDAEITCGETKMPF